MNERIASAIRHPLTVPITVGIASFGAGIGAGYILARRTRKTGELYEIPRVTLDLTEEDLEELLLEEDLADEVPQILRDIRDDPQSSDSERENVEKLIQMHRDKRISDIGPEENPPEEIPAVVEVDGEQFEAEDSEHLKVVGSPEEVTPVRRNAFASNDEDWDYEAEVRNRTTELPYILHKDEFYADEKGYSQITCTYYAGDRIMVDEDEHHPVYNHERTTGPLLFGHGSGDPKILYVRNDRLKAEYEIIHDDGLYSVEVLGLEIEDNQRVRDLKHMQEPARFRRE